MKIFIPYSVLSIAALLLLSACAGGASSYTPADYKYSKASEAKAIAQAHKFKESQYFNKAQRILSPFADSKASSAQAKIAYASLQLEMDSPEIAEIYAREALKQSADSIKALHVLALSLSEQGRTAEAEAVYKQALDTESLNPELLNDYALNLAEQEKLEEAIKVTNRALTLNPSNQNSLRNLKIFETILSTKPKKKDKAEASPPVPQKKPQNE